MYLTVLRAHSREGHLQYLQSLEADLADAAQDEDEGAEESVSASTVDKECEAVACELGIRYPTLQSIYAGKMNKQSIQVYIMYDILCILQTPNPHSMCCSSLAVANLPPAQRSDAGNGGNDPDREMDPDEACDYADQGPLPERDMEEDN